MTNYVCNSCGYRFESKSVKKCPYCDEDNVEREKTAEELVDSIDIKE